MPKRKYFSPMNLILHWGPRITTHKVETTQTQLPSICTRIFAFIDANNSMMSTTWSSNYSSVLLISWCFFGWGGGGIICTPKVRSSARVCLNHNIHEFLESDFQTKDKNSCFSFGKWIDACYTRRLINFLLFFSENIDQLLLLETWI